MKKVISLVILYFVFGQILSQSITGSYNASPTDILSVASSGVSSILREPDDIDNLWLWLDGGDSTTIHTNTGCSSPVTADGDEVRCWEDKSGNNFHVTNNNNNQLPTFEIDELNGVANSLSFDDDNGGKHDRLKYPLAVADRLSDQDMTFFMVFRGNELLPKNSAGLFASSTSSSINGAFEIAFKGTDDQFRYATKTTAGFQDVLFDTNQLDLKLYTITYNDFLEQVNTYVDGTPTDNQAVDKLQVDNIWVNSNLADNTGTLSDIAEVIMYDRLLTVCEINTIITYLAVKYDESGFQPIPVPGGSDCNELFFWIRTDVGVTSAVDGSSVSQWEDKAFSTSAVIQPVAGAQPVYRDNAASNINFHSVVDFDGVNDRLVGKSVIGANNVKLTAYIVAQEDVRQNNELIGLKSSAAAGDRYLMESPNGAGTINFDAGTNAAPQRISAAAPFPINEPFLARFENYNKVPSQSIYVNGTLLTTDATADSIFGMDSTSLGGIANFFDGKIPEFLLYESEHDVFASNSIQTYLALKYGITLSHDYFNTDTVMIYDVSNGYGNGIFGVAKDVITALDQPRSKSEVVGEAVTFELTTDIANLKFLISGHDNGGFARYTLDGVTNVITQKWFADMTGNVGTINVELDIANIGGNPASAAADVKIVIADNPALTNPHFIEATSVVAGIAYFEGIPLYDKYYTFSVAP